MTADASNIVAFAPRPARCDEEAELQFCELRLNNTTCNIELSLTDEAGNIVAVLEYAIVDKPESFELSRLVAAWSRWRGATGKAS